MAKLTFDITMSLDGLIAGPNAGPEKGLGDRGDRLHEWAFGLKAFHELHGQSGGTSNTDSEILEEALRGPRAVVIGRGMERGPGGQGLGGLALGRPVGRRASFPHAGFRPYPHARETLTKGETTFTFVTDGIGSALEQARAAAGDKDVAVAGGANVAQQYLKAGLLDELPELGEIGSFRLFGDYRNGAGFASC